MPKSKAPQAKKKLGGPRPPGGGPRADKVAAVEEIKARLTRSQAVILTEYRGLTVHDLADLREGLRSAGADYKIVKNTLAAIAAREAGLDALAGTLEGPTAIAYADGDPIAVAKHVADFAKRAPALVIKGGVLGGRVLSADDARALATVEPREVLLAKAAGMLVSPLQQLANVFAASLTQLGAVLVQLRDKRQEESSAA